MRDGDYIARGGVRALTPIGLTPLMDSPDRVITEYERREISHVCISRPYSISRILHFEREIIACAMVYLFHKNDPETLRKNIPYLL